MAKTKRGKAQVQRTAITISEAIGIFERAFLAANPNEVERYLREMLNVQVAVIDSKEEAERALAKGQKLRTVTVPFWVFRGKVSALLGSKSEDEDPGIYRLEANRILDVGEREKVLSPIYSADSILPGETFAILSKQAGYTSEKGLTFQGEGNPTGFEPLPEEEKMEKFTEGKFQTWKEHAEGVSKRSERLAELYRPFVEAWARNVFAPQWEEGKGNMELEQFVNTILWALRVSSLFHDIGKLDEEWQKIVWQEEEKIRGRKIEPEKEGVFIARTSPVQDKVLLKELKRPPSHAPFTYPFLRSFLRNLLGDYRFLDAIALATARHHSLEVRGGMPKGKFSLGIKAKEFLQNWLPQVLEITSAEDEKRFLDALEKALQSVQSGSEVDEPPSPSDDFYFLYCLTNRMVKLCDWEDAGNKVIELPELEENDVSSQEDNA